MEQKKVVYKKRMVKLTLLMALTFAFLFGFVALDLATTEVENSGFSSVATSINNVSPWQIQYVYAQSATQASIMVEGVAVADVFMPDWRVYIAIFFSIVIIVFAFFSFFKARAR